MTQSKENQIKVRAGQVWVCNGSSPWATRFRKDDRITVDGVKGIRVFYNEHFDMNTNLFRSIFYYCSGGKPHCKLIDGEWVKQ